MTRIGHKEIAREAGVSQSTVSRALAGHHGIPKETAKKVQETAKRLGYRPEPTFSRLAQLRWKRIEHNVEPCIGLVMETRRVDTNGIGDNTDLPMGMLEKCKELGYQLEVFYRDDYPNTRALERVLLARGITGLVLGPVYTKLPDAEMNWNHFVAVAASPGVYQPPVPSVSVDMFGAVTLAWEKAVAYGYERIGAALYEHKLNLRDDGIRFSAVRCCQERIFGHLPNIPVLIYDHNTPQEVFTEWVKVHNIETVVAFNSTVYWHLVRAGIRIPDEVALVDLHLSTLHEGLAGVLAGGWHSGAELIELVHKGLLANAYGVPKLKVHHIMEPAWMDGASLPRRKGYDLPKRNN